MGVTPLAASEPCACAPEVGVDIPVGLLTAFIDDESLDPPLHALTVDYELGSWRADALARHLVEWTTDYALRPKERRDVPPGRMVEVVATAIRRTFGSGGDRGIPGEVLLHVACRQFFGSDTVINKVVFKSATNGTYNGYDGVHVVHGPDGLELWLGEAKFYKNLAKAINAVLSELDAHLATGYVKDEFALVVDKIDDSHPHADELRELMHRNRTLDEVFQRVCVPVLLTYDSDATTSHDKVCAEYQSALKAELMRGWTRFKNQLDARGLPPVAVRLILVPMATKRALLDALDELT